METTCKNKRMKRTNESFAKGIIIVEQTKINSNDLIAQNGLFYLFLLFY